MPSKEWIGVDFDGTLVHYEGWAGHHHIGKPIPRMVSRVKKWLAAGKSVRIFTARVSDMDPAKRKQAKIAIEKWCIDHLGKVLPVTNQKDHQMKELWDDRAVGVELNTGKRK